MPEVRVHNFAVSIDGYGAGAEQTLEQPFGHADGRLMEWFTSTATFHAMLGQPGGTTGLDDSFASASSDGIGVEIMGRNKFGPQRGPWPDDGWTGWWGAEPPFHTPVIVLTHHPREPLVMEGGTTFHFVDATPEAALALARDAAPGLDVRIGGGVETVREFLAADLIDRLHLAVVPIVLGRGERLWDGLEGIEDRYDVEATASPSGVTHLVFTRKAQK